MRQSVMILLGIITLFYFLSAACIKDMDILIKSEMTASEIYSEYANDVVQIMAMDARIRTVMYTGAGFMVREDGLLVSAAHVIANNSGQPHNRIGIVVGSGDSKDVYKVKILKIDNAHDMALLKVVRDIKFKSLKMDYDYNPVAGDRIMTIGYPDNLYRLIGVGMIANDRPMNIVMSKDNTVHNDVVLTTMYLIPGNSGGPVFNMYGRVVGVATGGMHCPISIYQKIKYLRRLLNDKSDKIVISKVRTKVSKA